MPTGFELAKLNVQTGILDSIQEEERDLGTLYTMTLADTYASFFGRYKNSYFTCT